MMEQETELFKAQSWTVDFQNKEDQELLREKFTSLFEEETADHLIFILQTLETQDPNDFINHCNKATQKLGELLTERIGGEESFFDLVPESEYYDVQGTGLVQKFHYRGAYHSVGAIIKPKDLNHPYGLSVGIDFTYATVNKLSSKKRMVFVVPGNLQACTHFLEGHYGGKWEVEFHLQKDTAQYRYIAP